MKTFLFVVLSFFSAAISAKQAAPLAENPEIEHRVEDLTSELRCLVCQNQTINDSHAGLAIDLKNQVRDMMVKGKTNDEIVDYMVDRYGDFVRYRPPMKATTVFLWFGPAILFVIGATVLFTNLKRRRRLTTTNMSEEQLKQVDEILKSDKGDEKE